jgi:energy-coupling factor transporter transmembrane protein EcfT
MKSNPSHRLIGIYCLLYYLMISFYPYGNAGFRFLLPIFGFILFYAAIALKYFLKDFHPNKKIVAAILTLVLFYQYSFGLKMKPEENGPNASDATEMFKFIKNDVKDDETICFNKPKALSYYAEKKCVSINEFRTGQVIKNDLDKWNCSCFIFYSGVSGDSALKAVSDDSLNWKKVFSNNSSRVFKRKK